MPPTRTEFEEFAVAATPSLLRSAYLLTGDQHLAEDLVQTALSKTYRVWKRIERSENATAYTRKIMYHLQVSWWRRRRVTELLSDRPTERPVADESHTVDLRLSLRQALLKLTDKQRAIVVLRFFEDRSVVETAELLGCGTGTVKTQTFRSLNKLRAILPNLSELTNGAN